jgi:hypothetical protein
MRPFAIYDTRRSAVVYLGLHESASDCWAGYFSVSNDLAASVAFAKARGFVCLAATITYDPRTPL